MNIVIICEGCGSEIIPSLAADFYVLSRVNCIESQDVNIIILVTAACTHILPGVHTLADTLTHTHAHSHTHTHSLTHTHTHSHTHTHTQGVSDDSVCSKIANHILEHISSCNTLKHELRMGGLPSVCGDNICFYFRWFYPHHFNKCHMKGVCVCVCAC